MAIIKNLSEQGGNVSLDTIAGQIGTDADFLERQVEPYLLARGWIIKSSRGRTLTKAGEVSLNGHPISTPSESTI
jgi:Holliday junction resolvasome RuvABC ATP-dependent DNA helicase subunit